MTQAAGKTLEMDFASGDRKVKKLRIALPEGKPDTAVLIVHGMAEHYARYDELAAYLSKHGYLVAGFDLTGHGPDTPEQALGMFESPDGWQKLVKDINTARTVIAQRWPGIHVVLLGHSMGSFLAREYAIQHGQDLKGLVLSGSGWQPAGLCRFGLGVSTLQCLFGACNKPAKLLHKLNFGSNNRPFRPTETDYDWLTRDKDIVRAYAADPYCGFSMKVAGYRDLFIGLLQLTKLDRLKAVPADLPALFLSGTHDPLAGKDGQNIHTLAQQYREAGVEDVTVKLYEQARHEVFNEINREEVWADLLAWLSR